MTPQLAAKLTIHQPKTVEPEVGAQGTLAAPSELLPFPVQRPAPARGARGTAPAAVRRDSLQRRLLAVADLLAAGGALIIILSLIGDDRPGLGTLVGLPLVVVVFKIAGLYDRDELRLVHSTLDEAPLLAQLTGLYVLTIVILQPILIDGHLGNGQIAALWLVSLLSVILGRMVARSVAGRAMPVERCLVIGDPVLADQIRAKLAASHARAVVSATLPIEGDDVDRLEGPEGIRRMVVELQMDRVIIALGSNDASGISELIRIAKAAGVRVSVLPRMLDVLGSAVELEDVDGMTLLGVRPFGLSRSSRSLKRAFDLVTTSVGMLLAGPLIAAIAVAIRIESRGPIFFRQVRVGRDGRHFHIFKFRSMVMNAEEQKELLLAFNEVGEGMFKLAEDPRVTRVGRFLRRTSLDELPQIFNVLRGEMSLVGPRPLVTDEDARVIGLDRSRLHLTPGMTGPWQVLSTRVPMREMVGIDYLYVANWSLWLDLKVLARTARHVLRRGNV